SYRPQRGQWSRWASRPTRPTCGGHGPSVRGVEEAAGPQHRGRRVPGGGGRRAGAGGGLPGGPGGDGGPGACGGRPAAGHARGLRLPVLHEGGGGGPEEPHGDLPQPRPHLQGAPHAEPGPHRR
ncbi:unnamed protein product, partial [Arctogadus glacialis]